MYETIINKLNNDIECELFIDELKYIYEDNIKEFESIRILRNNYNDLCKLFGKKHVACTLEEINQDTICYIGDLVIDSKLPIYNLRYIYGSLQYKLNDMINLENLEIVVGNVYFGSMYNVEGLENLSIIVGDGIFRFIDSTESLISLTSVYGTLDLNNVFKSNGLDNLKYIGKDAYFNRLRDAEHLNNLEKINRDAYFNCLVSTKGLENLEYIGGKANFDSLRSIEYLNSNIKILGEQFFGHDGLSLEEFRKKEKVKCLRK